MLKHTRSHENDESRGPVHVSFLWQREEKKMDQIPEREREKESCKQRLSHENETRGPAQHVLPLAN